MRSFMVRCVIAGALLLVSSVNLGCPLLPPELELSADSIEIDFGAGETMAQFVISNAGGRSLDWTIFENAAWLTLSRTEGKGDRAISVAIDPSLLAYGMNTATLIVDSNGGSRMIAVSVFLGAGINSPYWPLAEGNSWTFAVPDFEEPGSSSKQSAVSPVLTMRVARVFEINGAPVVEILFEDPTSKEFLRNPFMPGLPLPIGPLAEFLGDGGLDQINGLLAGLPSASSLPLSRLADLLPKSVESAPKEDPGFSVFLVPGADGYFAGFDEERLGQILPATPGLLPWEAILSSLPKLVQGIEGGHYEQAATDISTRLAAAGDQLDFLGPELDAYLNSETASDRLIALSLAVGADLELFESPNPVAVALAGLIGTAAGGADDAQRFVDGLVAIGDTTLARIQALAPALEDYLAAEESAAVAVNLLRAFQDRFATYENADIVVQDFARFLGIGAGGFATVLESLDANPPEYSLDDPDLAAFLDAVREQIESGDSSADILETLDALVQFVEDLPTGGPASVEFKAFILDLLASARTLAGDAIEAEPGDFDPEDLDDLTSAAAALFAGIAFLDPDNVLAEFTAEVALMVDQAAGELVQVYPWIAALREDVATLEDAVQSFAPGDFDPGALGEVFAAIGTSAARHDAASGDVAAAALALAANAAADTFAAWDELHDRLESVAFSERPGALDEFTPLTLLNRPARNGGEEGGDPTFHPLVYGLADFGVGNPADSVASIARIVPAAGEGDPRYLPYLILSRDIGPVFFFGMTLQSYEVDDAASP